MIPLGDASRRPMNFAFMTTLVIAINIIVFILELAGGDEFVKSWSAIPADITVGHHLLTVLTSMFLHGGWMHIIGNMVFLWAFGPEIEDVMGPWRFLAFYLVGGVVAMVAQILANPASTVLMLGASGAIAAVMGGFLVTYPRDRIRTLLFFGFFVTVAFVPAALLIGVWFVLQILSASAGAITDMDMGGVAYLAHIGGGIFGAVTVRWFEDPQRIVGRTDW
jgi:membrane associated rhomboid family serine protease